MQNNLSANIRKHRKKMMLTQEQLAEAMGVTVGTVSKWENGNCIPDINMMMDLADFFNLSMDNLVGYTISSKKVDDILDEFYALNREHRLDEAIDLMEKSIMRYPNNVKLLKRTGDVYKIYWFQNKDDDEVRRKALELYNRALHALPDLHENKIDEIEILKELAILETDGDKKIEILKQINIGGVFNDTLGEVLWEQGKIDDAIDYFDKKLHLAVIDIVNVMGHTISYFFMEKRYKEMLEFYTWYGDILIGMTLPNKTCFLYRHLAYNGMLKGICHELLDEHDMMVQEIGRALEYARRFDAEPVYDIYTNVRFVYGTKKDIPVAWDDRASNTVDEIRKIVDEILKSNEYGFSKKELLAVDRVKKYIDEHLNEI